MNVNKYDFLVFTGLIFGLIIVKKLFSRSELDNQIREAFEQLENEELFPCDSSEK